MTDMREIQESLRAAHEADFQALRQKVARIKQESPHKEMFTVEGLERQLVLLGETTQGRSVRELEALEIDYYYVHRDMTTLAQLARAIAGT